jgi:hypothetical protein
MMAAVVLLHEPVWGLLAGKAVADVLFYVVSSFGYRVTELTGIRSRRRSGATEPQARREPISHM